MNRPWNLNQTFLVALWTATLAACLIILPMSREHVCHRYGQLTRINVLQKPVGLKPLKEQDLCFFCSAAHRIRFLILHVCSDLILELMFCYFSSLNRAPDHAHSFLIKFNDPFVGLQCWTCATISLLFTNWYSWLTSPIYSQLINWFIMLTDATRSQS